MSFPPIATHRLLKMLIKLPCYQTKLVQKYRFASFSIPECSSLKSYNWLFTGVSYWSHWGWQWMCNRTFARAYWSVISPIWDDARNLRTNIMWFLPHHHCDLYLFMVCLFFSYKCMFWSKVCLLKKNSNYFEFKCTSAVFYFYLKNKHALSACPIFIVKSGQPLDALGTWDVWCHDHDPAPREWDLNNHIIIVIIY